MANMDGFPFKDDIGFMVSSTDLVKLQNEYDEFTSLQTNAEIVLMEALVATDKLSTVLNQMKTFNNRMSPSLRRIFSAPAKQSSVKTIEFGLNRTRDQAAAQAATERVVTITTNKNAATEAASDVYTRLSQSRMEPKNGGNIPQSGPVNNSRIIHSPSDEGIAYTGRE